MNLVLLEPGDFVAEARVRLTGRRLAHVRDVHRARVGDGLVVGLLGDRVGRGRVVALDDEALEMEVALDEGPPPRAPVSVVLALPRPPVLRRVLIALASLGVARIWLIGARAVEKSFWQSRALDPDAIREQLVLGLEQGRDTVLPEVVLRRRFRPFAEDELPRLVEGADGLLAHPGPQALVPDRRFRTAVLAVGPEGGWSEHELSLLESAGLRHTSLGPRPLRVETVLPALIGRLL